MKKFLSLVLSVALLIAAMPVINVGAAPEAKTEGIFTYTVLDGEVTINKVDYETTGDVVIPEKIEFMPVTAIADSAFAGCSKITDVVIHDGVTDFGTYIFSYCTSLIGVTLPSNMNNIPEGMFERCTSLETVNIPDTVTSIGGNSFWVCESLTSITLPENLTEIGPLAFSCCYALENINMGDKIVELGDGAFEATEWYNNLPDGAIYVGKVLYDYKGACPKDVTLKEGTVAILDDAFSYEENLESITATDGLKYIGQYAFSGCTALTTVNLPDSVEYIEYEAFYRTPWLDSQPEGYIYIGKALYAYKGTCPKTLEIKEGTVGISPYAFSSSMEIVKFPATLKKIGDYAFYYDSNVKEVHIPSIEAWCNIEFGYRANPLYTGNKVSSYLYVNNVKTVNVVIPDTVKTIKNLAFEDYSMLISVTISEGVTSIGEGAFMKCDGLSRISIPSSVSRINKDAFYMCEGITEVTLGAGSLYIDTSAFNCDNLDTVYYRDTVEKFNKYVTISDSNRALTNSRWYFESCIGSRYHVEDSFGKCKVCGYRPFKLGDIDGDTLVNTSDLAVMKLYLAGAKTLDDADKSCADIDKSGTVDTTDLAKLKLYLAGAALLE